ncbi:hypothetical protein ACWGDX_23225 [Streptomyces sp. NPDC055025]
MDEMFRESKGQPVELTGKLVRLAYSVRVESRSVSAKIAVRSFKSEPTQGICLQMNHGELEVNDFRKPGMVLWLDTAPRVIYFTVLGGVEATLEIWNCWRGKFGEREAWIGSSGLVVDAVGGDMYHFACSDGPGAAEFTAVEFDLRLPT